MPSLFIPFGLSKTGRVVSPLDSEIVSGLKCGCTCLGCGGLLVAKKGLKLKAHFAHHHENASDACSESAVHAAAKQIIFDLKKLRLPPNNPINGLVSGSCQLESYEAIFDYCEKEAWCENAGIRADVKGVKKDRSLFIEIFYRHKVDEAKIAKIRKNQISALEIDISDIRSEDATFELLKQKVIESIDNKKWLSNAKNLSLASESLQGEITQLIDHNTLVDILNQAGCTDSEDQVQNWRSKVGPIELHLTPGKYEVQYNGIYPDFDRLRTDGYSKELTLFSILKKID